jgi:hypothetical protein
MTGRRRPPALPEPEKPFREMTDAERGAYLGQLRRALRDDEVRSGSRRPQAMREFGIAREGQLEREERMTRRAERAARRQPPPQDGREGITAEHLPDHATAGDVARWMADCLERDGRLEQRDAAHELAGRFGDQFTYVKASGHLAISQRVLTAFRKASGAPSWDQRYLCWLPRPESDAPQTGAGSSVGSLG